MTTNPKMPKRMRTEDIPPWTCQVKTAAKNGHLCNEANPAKTRYCKACNSAFWASSKDSSHSQWVGESLTIFSSVEEIVNSYTAALETGIELIERIHLAKVTLDLPVLPSDSYRGSGDYYSVSPEKDIPRLKKSLKKDCWRRLIAQSKIREIMSIAEVKKLDDAIESGELPDITIENVRSTLKSWRDQLPEFLQSATRELFEYLTPGGKKTTGSFVHGYSSNGWTIGKRIVLEYMVSDFGSSYLLNHAKEKHLQAMDNVFHLYDGQGIASSEKESALLPKLKEAIRSKDSQELETPYFKIRWFQNGNFHIYPHQEIAERINADMLSGSLPRVKMAA